MDKRIKRNKQITNILYFMSGMIVVGVGIKLDAYLNLPKWEDKQVNIVNTLGLVSPISQIPMVMGTQEDIISIQEATRSSEKKEVKQYELSSRAKKHTDRYPDIASKLLSKFGDLEIIELVSKESGLNPKAINKNSGACGLFQAYPCSKLPCDLDDVDCQIEWGFNYISKRYGSVKKALEFHNEKGWY